MPQRTTTRLERGFIWLPVGPTSYDIKVNGESVKTRLLSAEFTKGVCPEVGTFKVQLINFDSVYTNKYSLNQSVQLYADYESGTTLIFEGRIDKLDNKYDSALAFTLEISGVHITRELMDLTAIKSYDGSLNITQILDDLNSTYLSGYTVSNTSTYASNPNIKWDEKPIWDCIHDLSKLTDADCYISDTSVITFFDKNSIENNQEAIPMNRMISIIGFGIQSLTAKNKIKVYGDDGTGMPVIYTAEDTSSKSKYGTKVETLFDTSIKSNAQAEEMGEAQLVESANPTDEGTVETFLLPTLKPGDKIWIANQKIGVTGQFRIYKFIHKFPDKMTAVTIGKERKLTQLFKKRVEKELSLASITNPYSMTGSINFTFDDLTGIATKDSNVDVAGGFLKLNSGSEGRFTTIEYTFDNPITEIELRVVGNNITSTDFEYRINSGSTYVSLATGRNILPASSSKIMFRTKLNSATTELDSIAYLYK